MRFIQNFKWTDTIQGNIPRYNHRQNTSRLTVCLAFMVGGTVKWVGCSFSGSLSKLFEVLSRRPLSTSGKDVLFIFELWSAASINEHLMKNTGQI